MPANLDLSSSLHFFRSLYFRKATSTYSLCSKGVSYSRTREIVLQAFVELAYPKNLFGLHSLRREVLSRPLMQALAIGFLSVMEGGNRIKLKTVILILILCSQCLKVYIFSLPFSFSSLFSNAGINKRDVHSYFCVL